MKIEKALFLIFLSAVMLCPLLLLPVEASTVQIDFFEDFDDYAKNSTYPSGKLWQSTAKFTVKEEGSNKFLHMPFFTTNSDAAICPFQGTVSASHETLLVRMDLRPVYRKGNSVAKFDFRVRNFTYTDENGTEQSDRWRTFFRLHVEDEGNCYLSAFSNSFTARIPLEHGEWNTVLVSLDLASGEYTVSVGNTVASCTLNLSDISFAGNQLQFNQMQKGCTFATTEASATYVDIDNISISTKLFNVDQYKNLLGTSKAGIRPAYASNGEEAFVAGIRFLTEVDTDLLEKLMQMKALGEALSVQMGTLIAPSDYLSYEPLSFHLPEHARLDVKLNMDFPNAYYTCDEKNGKAFIAGSVSDLLEANLGRSFTARAYVDVLLATGQHFTIYSDPVEACAQELANKALQASGGAGDMNVVALLKDCAKAKPFLVKEELRLMSYNIYYSDLREERLAKVAEMINKHAPDIMGLQEANTTTWRDFLLKEFGDKYDYVGTGREAGGVGESTPILYRKDKFKLLESDTFWLSDTPLECSKYPSSRQNRIFTYVLLARKSDGKKFLVVNTHLDTATAEAKLLQVASLKKQLHDLCLDEYPLILTGDMNAQRFAEDGVIDSILAMGVVDSYDAAFTRHGMASIDYCFLDPQLAVVTNYVQDTAQIGGESPSDHAPVIIDIRF